MKAAMALKALVELAATAQAAKQPYDEIEIWGDTQCSLPWPSPDRSGHDLHLLTLSRAPVAIAMQVPVLNQGLSSPADAVLLACLMWFAAEQTR
jgi:hypothetical protein